LIRDLRSAGKDDRKIEVDNRAAAEGNQTLVVTVKEQSAQIQKVSAQVQLSGAPAIAANP